MFSLWLPGHVHFIGIRGGVREPDYPGSIRRTGRYVELPWYQERT